MSLCSCRYTNKTCRDLQIFPWQVSSAFFVYVFVTLISVLAQKETAALIHMISYHHYCPLLTCNILKQRHVVISFRANAMSLIAGLVISYQRDKRYKNRNPRLPNGRNCLRNPQNHLSAMLGILRHVFRK